MIGCMHQAAYASLTMKPLQSAFQWVGVWPLYPSMINLEEISKGATLPVESLDLEKLVARLIPGVIKKNKKAVIANGTMSTVGRTTVLSAEDLVATHKQLDNDRKIQLENAEVQV